MKKLVKSVLMLSIASLAILSSCKKSDETEVADVKIDVTAAPSSPVAGSAVTLTVVCTGNSDNNLKSISVTRTGGNSADKVVLSKTLSGTSSTQTIVDTLGLGTYIYTVALTGGKNNSPATKTITVTTREPYGTLQKLPVAVDLSGQTQDSSQYYFMKLTSPFTQFDRARKTFADNKANIDVCFYYGNANKASLASPDDKQFMQTVYTYIDWTGAKKSQFVKTTLTPADFDAIEASNSDSAIIEMAKTTTTWGVAATDLKKDNVVLYQTAEGKKGLIKVQNLIGQDAKSATISLSVISQN